jgi:CRP-like cAMP-binding protein
MGRAVQLRLAEELQPVEVIKDEVVCREGQPFDYLYFVRSGEF